MSVTSSYISGHKRQINHLAEPTNGEGATAKYFVDTRINGLRLAISKLKLKDSYLRVKDVYSPTFPFSSKIAFEVKITTSNSPAVKDLSGHGLTVKEHVGKFLGINLVFYIKSSV